MTATQQELANIFGVSQRTIQRWDVTGLAKHRIDGRAEYDVPGAVQWRRTVDQRECQEALATGAPTEIQESRARKLRAEARLLELDLGREEGELITLETYTQRLAMVLGRLSRHIDAIPASWSARLAAVDGDQEEVRLALRELIRELRAGMLSEADAIEEEARAAGDGASAGTV